MDTIRLRPEHIPQVLYFVGRPQEREMLFVTYSEGGFSPYSHPRFRENLRRILNSAANGAEVKVVPAIDDICSACSLREECGESDAPLFDEIKKLLRKLPSEKRQNTLEETLRYLAEKDIFLSQIYNFTDLIGQTLSIGELIRIRDREPVLA